MASLEEVLLASAVESLNIDDYWPEFDSTEEVKSSEDDDCDGEYPVILLFNETLLDHMINKKLVDADSVRRSIAHLISNYGRVACGKTPQDLDYNDLNNCFGYLHRYSACHTALVRNVLKRVFHVSPPPAIKRMLCVKDSLHVISLGGGPGNDIVGFISALYGRHYGFLHITFTLVDQMAGWQEVFNQTVKMVRRGNYGNASALFKDCQVQETFLRADLTNKFSWKDNLQKRLENADIFLLVKVLSVVPDGQKALFLQNIVSTMKPGSLLIYIDTPFPQEAFATVGKWLDCVYQCHKEKFQYNYEVERFGYANITTCQAFVRVYVRNSSLQINNK